VLALLQALALSAYQTMSQFNRDSYRAHQFLGDVHAAKNEDNKAIEEYRKAEEQKPDLPNLHYLIGHLLWKDSKPSSRRSLR
jgi:lipopolysaccharide biosynthesis regulator YciM